MHLLATTATNLDDIVEAVDLGQPPGDIAILSFADSDLTGLAAAWEAERGVLPSVRLAHLRDLRHPMSVDLWIDRVGAHAKVIVVRLLGGLDWWKYGIERLSALARERDIALAVLPGEDRDDARLAAASTLPAAELDTLLLYFREGGRENLRALLRRLAGHAGFALETRAAETRAASCRLSAGRRCGRSRPAGGFAGARQGGRTDHLLPRAAARCRHGADRCAVRGARGARPGAGSARRYELEGQRGGGLSARRFRATSTRRHCHHDGIRGRRLPASRRRSTRAMSRCCRSSAPRPGARPGARARAGSAPPISPCTSCCRSLTAASSPAPSRSRIRCRRRKASPSPRWQAAPSRIASRWSPIASRRWCACAHCRAASAPSRC